MRSFDEIFELAAGRKGGAAALEGLLSKLRSTKELARLGDDRYLAGLTKAVFRAGFNWKVIEAKWDGFETAFDGFDPHRWTLMSDEDLDRLVSDTRIVRHAKKILSVRDNAALLVALARDQGSAAKAIAHWVPGDFIGLLDLLRSRGARLGGTTAQYALRGLGVDGFVLSRDVIAALIREGVIDKPATGKAAQHKVQAAFDAWREQSGRSLTEISKTLAYSVGP